MIWPGPTSVQMVFDEGLRGADQNCQNHVFPWMGIQPLPRGVYGSLRRRTHKLPPAGCCGAVAGCADTPAADLDSATELEVRSGSLEVKSREFMAPHHLS